VAYLPSSLICEALSLVKAPAIARCWARSFPCFLIAAGFEAGRRGVKMERPAGRTILTPGRPARQWGGEGSEGLTAGWLGHWGAPPGQVVLLEGVVVPGGYPPRAGRPALSRCAERSAWLRRHDA